MRRGSRTHNVARGLLVPSVCQWGRREEGFLVSSYFMTRYRRRRLTFIPFLSSFFLSLLYIHCSFQKCFGKQHTSTVTRCSLETRMCTRRLCCCKVLSTIIWQRFEPETRLDFLQYSTVTMRTELTVVFRISTCIFHKMRTG